MPENSMKLADRISQLSEEIKKTGANRVLLQLPEGLKRQAAEIISQLEGSGLEIVYASDPTYGACDLRVEEARLMQCGAIVHVGHSKFYRHIEAGVPVIYFPWLLDADISGIDFSAIKEGRMGIVTSVQHTHLMDRVKQKLEEAGKEAVIGGQILGCWFENAKKIESSVDALLFVGSGRFHPLGIKSGKPVYTLDLETMEIDKLDAAQFEKRRYANIFRARDAKSFAVLVSTKEGQAELLRKAKRIKDYLQKRGRRAFILVMDEISDEKLAGLQVDAYVNTACPRITDNNFSRPVINATDIELLFEDMPHEA